MKKMSIWLNENDKGYQEIDKNMEVDVLIVGGGITGLSTIFELKDSGLKTPKFDSCYLKISRKARKNLVFYLFYN